MSRIDDNYAEILGLRDWEPFRPIEAVIDGSAHGVCVVCGEPAPFVVLGSFRCVSHKETTVVGEPPAAPKPAVEITVPRREDCAKFECIGGCVCR